MKIDELEAELEFIKVQKSIIEKEKELAEIEEELGRLTNLRDELVVNFINLRMKKLKSEIEVEING